MSSQDDSPSDAEEAHETSALPELVASYEREAMRQASRAREFLSDDYWAEALRSLGTMS